MSTVTDDLQIIMQKGIRGGFAPPTPTARYGLTRATGSDVLSVTEELRHHGTPRLGPPRTRELNVADHTESIARLQYLLRNIPTQYPGARDLYDRDISIVQATHSSDFVNFHRSGSAAGEGIADPTPEQRVQFDEAVAIIERLCA